MNGQRQVELTSLPLFALHPDAAAVCLDGALAKSQSKSGASHARSRWRLRLLELPEDDLVILLRDACSVVRDGKQHAIRGAIVACSEPDLHVARRMCERVLNQIGE